MQATEKIVERETDFLREIVFAEIFENDIFIARDTKEYPVSFYQKGFVYNVAEIEYMQIQEATEDTKRWAALSMGEFIGLGNVPAYNGHDISFYCRKGEEEGDLILNYNGKPIPTAKMYMKEVKKAIDEGKIKINIVNLESKVA